MSNTESLCLLTGATGFIGRRIQTLLTKRGYRLRVLSRRAGVTGPSIDWLVGDLTDRSTCRRAVEGIDVIIHVAGEKRQLSRFWPVNVQGTENLLAAALDEGIERFVHMSSVGVIGADPLQGRMFDEYSPCMPRNDYERSKWEAEKLVRQAATEGLPVAILRPANVFGDRNPEKGLLRLVRIVLNGWFVYLGGRDAICNYVFVEDVAYACMVLAEHPNAVGQIFHLSDMCTLGEFVDVLADELGVTSPRIQAPGFLASQLRAALRAMRRVPQVSQSSAVSRLVSLNNQARFATTRLVDKLGFRYPVGWRAGLGRVVKWYRAQGEL